LVERTKNDVDENISCHVGLEFNGQKIIFKGYSKMIIDFLLGMIKKLNVSYGRDIGMHRG
jgi:hypothetical protein